MFDPFGRDEDDEPQEPRPPFPTPSGALMLTFGASMASMVVALLFFEEIDLLALGVGEALGVGGVATFAARRVPDPQPERLGLRGFPLRFVPVLLCLVPLVILVSELDNFARDIDASMPSLGVEEALTSEAPTDVDDIDDLVDADDVVATDAATSGDEFVATDAATSGDEPKDGISRRGSRHTAVNAPEAAGEAAVNTPEAADDLDEGASPEPVVLEMPEGWALVQVAIVSLGISPVVEGFLFFGVILQGLVTWLGRRRGLLMTGSLYALIHAFGRAGPDTGVTQALIAIVSLVAMGGVLGLCRLATGSVFAPILVDTCFKAMGLVSLTMPDLLAIPGYNVEPEVHTPLFLVLASLATVGWGLRVLTRTREPASP